MKIERSRAIPMGFRLLCQADSAAPKAFCPGIHIFGPADDNSDMMDKLISSRFDSSGQFVQGEVILAGGKVCVVGVRHPFQPHPKDVLVELEGVLHVTD